MEDELANQIQIGPEARVRMSQSILIDPVQENLRKLFVSFLSFGCRTIEPNVQLDSLEQPAICQANQLAEQIYSNHEYQNIAYQIFEAHSAHKSRLDNQALSFVEVRPPSALSPS